MSLCQKRVADGATVIWTPAPTAEADYDPQLAISTATILPNQRGESMSATPLRKLYRSIGKNLAQDKRTCNEMIAGLKRSAEGNLASMFAESLEINSAFDGIAQPFLNATSSKARKKLTSGSRGDNRIVYLLSERETVAVINGPRGYAFRYVGHQVPPFRQEGVGRPRSGAGGIDYTAVAGKTPVLGEIKRSGDKNAFFAFVQLLTYLSEMATPNQVMRATKHKEFGVPLKDPQQFDLHVLLGDLNKRSATLGLIEPTRQLAELFRERLGRQHGRLLGKTLCLEMNSAAFAESPDSTLGCLWVA
jgi:hypothetical protein